MTLGDSQARWQASSSFYSNLRRRTSAVLEAINCVVRPQHGPMWQCISLVVINLVDGVRVLLRERSELFLSRDTDLAVFDFKMRKAGELRERRDAGLKLSEVLKKGQAAAHSPERKVRDNELGQCAEDGRVSRRDIQPVSEI